ncbi:NAD(+) diphosphatase [Rhodobaculum claviforme]|uniref:NAD(+) diphosphatase n=1 Tax=Rhodobaculum claviforme TaxID=1549854 RepID=A0A934TJ33_9RHOB|nr:NAD(+) diphosphatase [Rhodobaculum claviforme]MBK5927080.1 NADH pyrophosphatase [Rhodobaculum claviforme]
MRLAEAVTFGGTGGAGAQAGLDRGAHLRGDDAAVARLLSDPAARVLPMWRGKPLIAGDGRDRPGWLATGHAVAAPSREPPLFLGLADGAPRFAVDVSDWQPPDLDVAALAAFSDPSEQHHPDLPTDHRFTELRSVMTRLPPREAELIVTARALIGWHRSHRFCSACGARSAMREAGWRRHCDACSTSHFPRSDPVVIMLVTRGDRLLLGRSPGWPEGMYSLLAGFIEPGETIEAAVRREVREEVGVPVGAVRYLASQPWPFPASLMLGCAAEALDDTLSLDPKEIEAAEWLDRQTLVDILGGHHPRIRGARPGAIAHFLIRQWLADRLD